MEDEGEALGWGEAIEHEQQGWADRLGENHLLFWGESLECLILSLERLFPPGAPGAEHAKANAGEDRGEPPAEVVDALGVGSAQADPGLLDGVLRFGERTEHPVGHGLEPWPARLERGGEVAIHHPRLTRQTPRM